MENPIKMDDLGPTPIFGNTHMIGSPSFGFLEQRPGRLGCKVSNFNAFPPTVVNQCEARNIGFQTYWLMASFPFL